MIVRPDIDSAELPLDPEESPTRPPLSGTVDDYDDVDDERDDENDAPVRAVSDSNVAENEFRLDEITEDTDENAEDA